MTEGSFRVIIVGAGPVGLYLAHAMERANIDYIVLEQQATALNTSGQLLFTWPQTVRLLDQLGLYQEAKEVAIPIHYKKRVYGHDGSITSANQFWDYVEPSHGYPFLPMLRSDLIKILYTNLKDRDTNIITSAEVVDIETHSEGVRVQLASGRNVEGSVVIGADGVHSKSRKLMHKLAGQAPSEDMVSSFHGIFGWAAISDLSIESEVFFESRGGGAVIQSLGTPEKLRFVALKPLSEPFTGRKRYTRQEMEEYAASVGDVAVCPGVKFKDVWERADKDKAQMLNQEEGFMSRWHHDRLVLVGDAVHKSTSVNGLGMTCGLHSAAVLASLLQDLVKATSQKPTTDEIDHVFSRYQQGRQREVKPVWDGGYSMIREVTRDSLWSWMWDKYVLPWFDVEGLVKGLVPSYFLIRHGAILSYVPFVGEQGSIPWLRRPIA
ncbi:putative FAD-binding domain-containing protein [Seiridium cardinale]